VVSGSAFQHSACEEIPTPLLICSRWCVWNVRAFEQVLEKALGRVEEVARDQEVLRVAVVDPFDTLAVETIDDGAGVAEDDRRMRGDEELRVSGLRQVAQQPEERQLPLGRERRLRFVQQVDALLEPVCEERHERLAVRLLVQRSAAIGAQV
jgi:hypothetical protein